MTITEAEAARVLYAAHEAWNRRDLKALLELFEDEMVYWNNVPTPDGDTLVQGKPAFESFLTPLLELDGLSVPQGVKFKDGVATASVEFYLRDHKTGYSHSGTFRQVLRFRNGRILRMEEFHDAPALSTFMALLSNESPAG